MWRDSNNDIWLFGWSRFQPRILHPTPTTIARAFIFENSRILLLPRHDVLGIIRHPWLSHQVQQGLIIFFPTLGEVSKLVIDCSGLLAQKGHSSDLIKNDTQKKTVQTQLRRLAREEGDLNKNLSDLLLLLEGLLSEHLGDDRLSFNMMNAVREVLEAYRQSLNSSWTYLDKEQSISWYVSEELINCAIYSITWNSQI